MDSNELKKKLGIPCGCDNRREIMSAGSWQTDAVIVGAVGVLIVGALLFKYSDTLKVGIKTSE